MDLNYFSDGEYVTQQKFKKIRDKVFGVFVGTFRMLHITPNVISIIGVLSLIAFVYFATSSPIIAFAILVLHVVLDGLDGVLARATNAQSQGGAFLDMVCDHSGMVIVTTTLIFYSILNPVIGLIYVYLYTLLVVFITIRNLLKRPIKWAFRSKYILYALFGLFAFTGINILNEFVVLFIILMIVPTITSMPIIMGEINKQK